MQYEYRTIALNGLPNADYLTELGAEGWLLVALIPLTQGESLRDYRLYVARVTPPTTEDLKETLRNLKDLGRRIGDG